MTDEAMKSGNRNNADDRGRIRTMRAHAREIDRLSLEMEPLDADPTPEVSEITEYPLDAEKAFVFDGGAVKALGEGRVGGYLVRFSTENEPDLSGEFFAADTDYGEAEKVPVFYHHGLDSTLKKRRIGVATLRRDEVGIWAETQLALRDDYERMIYEMAEAGKLGYSSGAVSHLAEYENTGKARKIKTWLLGEASLTPTPCEPRNSVIPLKSISVLPATDEAVGLSEAGDAPAAVKAESPAEPTDINPTTPKEEIEMEINEEFLAKLVKDAAAEAVKSYQAAEPARDTAGRIEVTLDEADRPFLSLAEQAHAIKSAAVNKNAPIDPRLNRMAAKANGANELIDSQGGYLMEPTLVSEIIKPMWETGPFTSRVRRLPTATNYGWINGVDETSRADGSRWGGVRGYWLAEAGSLTASKPAFKRINWELNKLGVLMYATDEQLADVAQFNAIAQQSAGEELSFMVNAAIFEGDGLGKPLGIMNSGALVTVTRDTASSILDADIRAMWARLLPRSRANAAWFVPASSQPMIDGLYQATVNIRPEYVSYGNDGVQRLYGRPVIYSEYGKALNTTGDILLADLSEYLFWEKSVNSAMSIHLAFLTDETAFRWIFRCDGQTAMSSAVTPYNAGSTLSSFVVLGSAT